MHWKLFNNVHLQRTVRNIEFAYSSFCNSTVLLLINKISLQIDYYSLKSEQVKKDIIDACKHKKPSCLWASFPFAFDNCVNCQFDVATSRFYPKFPANPLGDKCLQQLLKAINAVLTVHSMVPSEHRRLLFSLLFKQCRFLEDKFPLLAVCFTIRWCWVG